MTATDQNPQQSAQPTPRKTINVVGAAIVKDGKVLCAQRGEGRSLAGFWEFPGGKIEPGETPQEALAREIREELDADITVGQLIETVEYDYPKFHLSMDCFWCGLNSQELVLREHEDARWLTADDLYSVDWLPADIGIIGKIKQALE